MNTIISSRSFFNQMFALNQAKRAARLRQGREAKREERQDPIYGAALREKDRLRYLTRTGVVTPKKAVVA